MSNYFIANPLNNKINPASMKYEMENIGMAISRPLPQSAFPTIAGNVGDSALSEIFNSVIDGLMNDEKKEKKNK